MPSLSFLYPPKDPSAAEEGCAVPSVTPNLATRRCTCVERLVLLFQELHYSIQLLISRAVQAFNFTSSRNQVQQPSIYCNRFAIHERVLGQKQHCLLHLLVASCFLQLYCSFCCHFSAGNSDFISRPDFLAVYPGAICSL